MKLLTKSQIQESRNKEHKLEIDQALALARKVDDLRETKEKEQIALIEFRNSSMARIKQEIESEMSKRDSLSEEVKDLEERKTEALKPLDEKWEELRQKEAGLEKSKAESDILVESLKARERDLALKEEQEHSLLIQAKSKLEDARTKQVEAISMKDEADKTLKSAQALKEGILLGLSIKTSEVDDREVKVAIRERDVKIKEDNLQKISKELSDRNRAINDKYATLLRSQEILKNKQ